jgi:cell division protein FtsL
MMAPEPVRARRLLHAAAPQSVLPQPAVPETGGPGAVPGVPGLPGAAPAGLPAPLRVVRPGERSARSRQRRARWLLAGAVVFFATMVFGLVGVHVMLAQNQMRLDRLNAQASADEVRYERLRLQEAQLAAPARIVAEATKAGMVAPPGITYLNPSRQPATPVTAGPAPSSVAASDWTEIKPELAAHP